MSSDHLPIKITINSGTENRKHNKTFINYKKAEWDSFTNYVEQKIELSEETNDPHKLNNIITNAIKEASKKFVPKGNIRKKTKPMPENIREKINQRNELRKEDPSNIQITALNDQIKEDINAHKRELWHEKIDSTKWYNNNNATRYWQTMKMLQGKQQKHATNRTIEFNNKICTTNMQIANGFTKQYTGIAPKQTTKERRKTLRKVKNMKKENITITEEEVVKAIKSAPNKKSAGPDEVTTIHMKHLGSNAIKLLAKLYTESINQNIIPQVWKTAKIIPIPKPGKDKNLGPSYRPISLLSNIAKTFEKIILARIEPHLPQKSFQHGYKSKHSTTTALQHMTNIAAKGFNKKRPPQRTILIAIDMSRAFDVIDHRKLIEKMINLTSMPPIFIKYLSNYIQGRRAYTVYNDTPSHQRSFHGGVPQGGVLSPALFNLFMSDIPEPDETNGTGLSVYADDVTMSSSHHRIEIAEANAQEYLDRIITWLDENNLILADKTQATLLTPDPAEYNRQLNLTIKGKRIETTKHSKILGLIFDPKLNFSEHIKETEDKAKGSLKLLKAISGTSWGQQKETIVSTAKQYIRPIIEYACPVWSPIASDSKITKLQRIQNAALRCATGHTKDTNINHLHSETLVLPLKDHMKMITSQYRESCRDPEHPMNTELHAPGPERRMKGTALDTECVTVIHSCDPEEGGEKQRRRNKQAIHTSIFEEYLQNLPLNPLIQAQPPKIHPSEKALPRETRLTLAQLRAQKSPLLQEYLHNIGAEEDPSSPCADTTPQHCPHLRVSEHPDGGVTNPSMAQSSMQRQQTCCSGGRLRLAPGAANEAQGAALQQ